jgi:hypothetical protein
MPTQYDFLMSNRTKQFFFKKVIMEKENIDKDGRILLFLNTSPMVFQIRSAQGLPISLTINRKLQGLDHFKCTYILNFHLYL